MLHWSVLVNVLSHPLPVWSSSVSWRTSGIKSCAWLTQDSSQFAVLRLWSLHRALWCRDFRLCIEGVTLTYHTFPMVCISRASIISRVIPVGLSLVVSCSIDFKTIHLSSYLIFHAQSPMDSRQGETDFIIMSQLEVWFTFRKEYYLMFENNLGNKCNQMNVEGRNYISRYFGVTRRRAYLL